MSLSKCNITVNGFAYFWSLTEKNGYCVCGKPCHLTSWRDNCYSPIIRTGPFYLTCDNSSFKRVEKIPDDKNIKSYDGFITFTHKENFIYTNDVDGSTYHLISSRHIRDNSSEPRQIGTQETGGDEIYETMYEKIPVTNTRRVPKNQHVEGSFHYGYVDKPYKSETFAFADNKQVGYNYSYGTTSKFSTWESSSEEETVYVDEKYTDYRTV